MYRPIETISEENQSFKMYLYAIGILVVLVILLLIIIINLNIEIRRLKASELNQDVELGKKPPENTREKRNYKDKSTQVGQNSTTSSSEEEPEFHNKARRFASSSIFPKGQNPFAMQTATDTESDSNFLRTIS